MKKTRKKKVQPDTGTVEVVKVDQDLAEYSSNAIVTDDPDLLSLAIAGYAASRDILCIIDRSYSMNSTPDNIWADDEHPDSRITIVKRILPGILRQRMEASPGARIEVLLFDSNVTPLGSTDDISLDELIARFTESQLGGTTNVLGALDYGIAHYKTSKNLSRHIILVTDGTETYSTLTPHQELVDLGVVVDVILISTDECPRLRQLTKDTGGTYTRTSTGEGLTKAIEAAGAKLALPPAVKLLGGGVE